MFIPMMSTVPGSDVMILQQDGDVFAMMMRSMIYQQEGQVVDRLNVKLSCMVP